MAASIAIFAFVDAALLQPLPYQNPSRLVVAYETTNSCRECNLSYPDYLDWKKANTGFSSFEAWDASVYLWRSPEGVQAVRSAHVSGGFFRSLGVAAMLGRVFTDTDDTPAAPRAVVLMYGTWQSRFGGRQDIVGQSLILDNAPYSVIGVLPREFHFAMRAAEFFTTIHDPSRCEQSRGCHDLYGLGRLRDGVSLEAATAETKAIAARLEKEYPESNKGRSARLVPFRDAIVGDIRPTLLVLSSGAGLLLLIAYVNVASLLLVRAESRKRETVLRGVLGASVGAAGPAVCDGRCVAGGGRGGARDAGGFRGHSPAVPADSGTPAARNAVFSRCRTASARAAVRRRGFTAGDGGLLRDAAFAAVAFQPARGPCRRRARLGGNIMEAFRIEPGGGGTGDRDGAAGQRGTVGQEPLPACSMSI